METFREVIDLWATPAEMASDIGEKPGTVRQWRFRDKIPAEKWLPVAAAAQKKGFPQITFEALDEIAARYRSEADVSEAV